MGEVRFRACVMGELGGVNGVWLQTGSWFVRRNVFPVNWPPQCTGRQTSIWRYRISNCPRLLRLYRVTVVYAAYRFPQRWLM